MSIRGADSNGGVLDRAERVLVQDCDAKPTAVQTALQAVFTSPPRYTHTHAALSLWRTQTKRRKPNELVVRF